MPPGSKAGDPQAKLGSRMAKLFRQSRQLTETRACDLSAFLAEDEIEVMETESEDPRFAASLSSR